jgi:hypothetical protein
MRLFGIREVEGDKVTPLSILARVMVSGCSPDGLTDSANFEAQPAISVGSWGRRTLFVTYDFAFAAEILLDENAEDFREYFELYKDSAVKSGKAYHEVYDVLTGERVAVDINDPELAELKIIFENRRAAGESCKA